MSPNRNPDFKFTKAFKKPVFDISPNHARMACCYRDKIGTYHLFVDFIDASLNTVHSFQAIVKYYKSADLLHWTPMGTVIDKSSFNYKNNEGDPDCYGIGSPDVICTDDFIYLFYAGRGSLAPDQNFSGLAHPGEPGYVSSDLMYAVATLDKNGAPVGQFIKKGVILEKKNEWELMRLDDPCVVLEENTLHLYYKGFSDNSDRNNLKLGYASSNLKNINFIKNSKAILSVNGGLEMPRVFKYKGSWNMFLRHFLTKDGAFWRHYVSKDGICWELENPNLFNCAGPEPGKGATDIMLIKNFDGSFSGKALACGLEDSCLKLWLYHVINSSEEYQLI